MRDEHITDILDGGPVAGLGETELARVRAHAARCAACARAYEAARVSQLLLAERAAREFEPPPFFQTRVLAALRERQAAGQAWSLGRLWNAAGALVASMAVTVAALAALTFLAPEAQPGAGARMASASDVYSAEELLLAGGADEEMTDEQVLSSIYESAEDSPR
jgi:hypothetical protein